MSSSVTRNNLLFKSLEYVFASLFDKPFIKVLLEEEEREEEFYE